MPVPNSGDHRRGTSRRGADAGDRGPGAGEFAAIERLRHLLPAPGPGETWIGDDAAVLDAGDGVLLLTTDLSVEGVHADLDLIGLDDFGWRALAAAVSDIAAMGGDSGHVLVGVAGPAGLDIDHLYEGIAAAAAELGTPVVGGDLSLAPRIVVACSVAGRVPAGAPVLRSGARPGHELFVTGPLGASAAGLRILRRDRADQPVPVRTGSVRPGSLPESGPAVLDPVTAAAERAAVRVHRRPVARLAEGGAARRAGASAMIDVSDGLAADLTHLARASGVGLLLEHVPVATAATVDEAIGGGEDYELVIATADAASLRREFDASGLAPPIALGHCTDRDQGRLWGDRTLDGVGWEHPFGGASGR